MYQYNYQLNIKTSKPHKKQYKESLSMILAEYVKKVCKMDKLALHTG
jgi:hypothetical protein